MIDIEKGVNMPPERKRPGRSPKYPFKQMEVGDSFLITDPYVSKRGIVSGYAGVYSKLYAPMRFIQRRLPGGSLRIWRVE